METNFVIRTLLPAFCTGVVVAAVYFGGLWLTVRRLPTSASPLLLYVGSLIFRMALLCVSLLMLLKHTGVAGLLAAFVGLLLTRTVLVGSLRQQRFPHDSLIPNDSGNSDCRAETSDAMPAAEASPSPATSMNHSVPTHLRAAGRSGTTASDAGVRNVPAPFHRFSRRRTDG